MGWLKIMAMLIIMEIVWRVKAMTIPRWKLSHRVIIMVNKVVRLPKEGRVGNSQILVLSRLTNAIRRLLLSLVIRGRSYL